MAILIVEHRNTLEGARLGGRVLIGRRATNQVVVDDPEVSRIHAWIDTEGPQSSLTDAGSRTGTFVNGQRVSGRIVLDHGDKIVVGPATLTYRTDAVIPAGVSNLNFEARSAVADGGILFDCTCGAPLWISTAFAGRLGKCRFCSAVVRIPKQTVAAPTMLVASPASNGRPASPAESRQRLAKSSEVTPAAQTAPIAACGVCQSPIVAGETSTVCPACRLTFHADCWDENCGCSAYGCSQVNILLPKAVVSDEPLSARTERDDATEERADSPKVPVEFILLAVSVVASLLGALAFGVPALLALGVIVVYARRQRGKKIGRPLLAAASVASLGVVLGVLISYIWWIKGAV